MKGIDRSIREVSPGEGFVRIAGPVSHTGGVWKDPTGQEVWKPLDGGNIWNGPHYPTLEAVCLEEMAGEVGFPRNWRTETANGREWLVRKVALVYGEDCNRTDAPALGAFVETAIRNLNAKGWELGDAISIAFDTDLAEWFILDLSTVHDTYKTSDLWEDSYLVENWWEAEGYDSLRKLRNLGRTLVTDIAMLDAHQIPFGWGWVYASRYRPVSKSWAFKLRDTVLVQEKYDPQVKVHTWIIAENALDESVIFHYELTLAWWPWDTPARREK